MMQESKFSGNGPGGHPDWNELALLADEGPDAVDPLILEHLAGCTECQAGWAEAARYRSARLIEGDKYHLPDDLLVRGKNMIEDTNKTAESRSSKIIEASYSREASRLFWRPVTAAWMGGALLTAVLALFVIMPGLREGGEPHVPRGFADPVTLIGAALESQSCWGMIFPGMTGSGGSVQAVYRSGDGTDASLREALEQLAQSSTGPNFDPDQTWWLAAGYVATGSLGIASDLVHQALRRNPDNVRLLHLQAISAWQLSEFDRAEHALHRILALAPTDSIAMFNLALVQIDTGRQAEADILLEKLADGSQNKLLQKRAQDVLVDRVSR